MKNIASSTPNRASTRLCNIANTMNASGKKINILILLFIEIDVIYRYLMLWF
jgi:hypothetical protein